MFSPIVTSKSLCSSLLGVNVLGMNNSTLAIYSTFAISDTPIHPFSFSTTKLVVKVESTIRILFSEISESLAYHQ